MSPEKNKLYMEQLEKLNDIQKSHEETSTNLSGIYCERKKNYWASALFTRLCILNKSLILLLPQDTNHNHWDVSSIAGIIRSIIETRLTFYYISVENITDEEWECREILFNLHDNNTRQTLFKGYDENKEQYCIVKKELQEKLKQNIFFKDNRSITEKQKKEYLKGKSAYFLTFSQIAEKMNIKKEDFKFIYKLLSNLTHPLPFSYYRSGDNNRGTGIKNDPDLTKILIFLEHTLNFLKDVNTEYKKIFTMDNHHAK